MRIVFRAIAILLCMILLVGCAPTTGDPPAGGDQPEGYEPPARVALSPFVHFSFDDAEFCFINLKNNQYASIWEEPFLSALKRAHDDYGVKISLYVWKDVLHDQSAAHVTEWQACADWLKIGLHSDGDGNFAEASYDVGRAAWEHFVADVYAMTGTYDIIDRMPRLHNFAGSEESLRGMRDATCGALGFLAADDTRVSYSLGETGSTWLQAHDYLTDESGLTYLTTDLRCERHKKDVFAEVLTEKFGRANEAECYILFTHEYEVYNGETVNEYFSWLDDMALYFFENQIPFAFPADFAYPATKGDIT